MKDLFFALWFFLPAGVGNVTPIFVAHIPIVKRWNYPIDFYATSKGKRIFGDHKTIRGFIAGIILGITTSVVLFSLASHVPYTLHSLPQWYFSTNPILLGLLLSFGALLGDMIKSFFKRRANRKPGSSWIPFDQIDYIVGGLILGSFVHILSVSDYILITIVWILIHVLSTYSGYFLHLKDHPL